MLLPEVARTATDLHALPSLRWGASSHDIVRESLTACREDGMKRAWRLKQPSLFAYIPLWCCKGRGVALIPPIVSSWPQDRAM